MQQSAKVFLLFCIFIQALLGPPTFAIKVIPEGKVKESPQNRASRRIMACIVPRKVKSRSETDVLLIEAEVIKASTPIGKTIDVRTAVFDSEKFLQEIQQVVAPKCYDLAQPTGKKYFEIVGGKIFGELQESQDPNNKGYLNARGVFYPNEKK